MTEYSFFSTLGALLLFLVHVAVIARVILRPHREPASRIAWIVMIIALPVVGMVSYLLLGETNIGRRRVRRMREMLAGMPSVADAPGTDAPALQAEIPERYSHLFRVGRSVNGFEPVGGNHGRLLPDSNASIESLVSDIDAAKDHVHLIFYIWLPDNNGLKVVGALKRAAARKVTCRVMADGLGSRIMIDSEHWKGMHDARVHVATALPIGNLLLRPLLGRIDLRNHRKIVVIDDWITYCGSQNCADPEFLIKAKYAPWVDALMRFEGPIARQNQHLFAGDWMAQEDEDIRELLLRPFPRTEPGFTAQVIGTGPTVRNDSFIVQAASRSYYSDLLVAGVRIFEFEGGLLHTKSLTLDGEITLIGSANMDRRSFDLHYENNILFCDSALTAEMRRSQEAYLAQSHEVTAEMVAQWPITRRLWNNAIAMLGPVL